MVSRRLSPFAVIGKPNTSAVLDSCAAIELVDTHLGFLPNRLTTAQRDAIPDPTIGLTVYNVTLGRLESFDGAVWERQDQDALIAANNLSDVSNAGTSRTNLGLGTAATFDSGDFDPAGAAVAAATTAQAAAEAASLARVNNLSDLVDPAEARDNLGLGSAAEADTGDFDPAGSAAAVEDLIPHRNIVVNPCMHIDQLNEGAAVVVNPDNTIRIVDQWYLYSYSGDAILTGERVADGPPGISHSVKITTTQANTTPGDTLNAAFGTDVEMFSEFKLGTASSASMSVSFWAKTSTPLVVPLIISSFGDPFWQIYHMVTITGSTWQQYKWEAIPPQTDSHPTWYTPPNNGMFVAIALADDLSNPAGTPDVWSQDVISMGGITDITDIEDAELHLTGFKVEMGDTCTPLRQDSFADDLKQCQRYFRKTFPVGVAPAQDAGLQGSIYTRNTANGVFSVVIRHEQMASSPSVTFYNPSAADSKWNGLLGATDVASQAAFTKNPYGFTASSTGAEAIGWYAIQFIEDAWF